MSNFDKVVKGLENKILEEEKPAQKLAEPKKEQPKLGSFKSDKPLMKDDVEFAKKLGMDKDEYKYQSDTAMSILLGRELPSKKDYVKNPAEKTQAPKQKELFKEFDQEFEDWGDYIYGGLNPEEQAKTLSERKKVPYETAKSYIDTMAKDRESAYKGALAQFPKIEEAIAKTYPQGTDEYKTFDSQFLTSVLSGYLPMPLGSDQKQQVEKEFAKYLYSKGYKDVSNNPIVKYEEKADPKIAKKAKYVIDNYPEFFDERTYDLVERDGRYFLYNPTSEKEEEITAKELADIYDQTMSEGAPSGNQLQDELQGLVADLKATSQANKEPLEYDERFLEDATGYLTKSLDEQGTAEINRQFKEMLDKAGFKNITPGAEAVESANAKQSALSQYFGGEEYKPTDWDEDVFTNAAGEEYYVATPEEARERAKEEVRSFIEDQGIQGFSDQFKDWILSDGLNPNFLKNSKDEYIESFREEGNEDAAQWLEGMDDEQFLDTLRYELIGDDDSFWNYIDPYGIDRDRIIEEAIDWDGVAHFLAYYDGDEIELPNGLYAYRLN